MEIKKVMILVVAYNAETTISRLLDEIPEEIWGKAEEVVVADDYSQDDTTGVVQKYKREKGKENLSAVRHEKNRGYGGNQKWGYNYAIEKGYDIVVMLHGDVQYSPGEIPKLLVPLERGEADMVFGSRIAGDPLGGGMPLYKFLGNKFLATTENFVLRKKLSEYHSGFRLYSVSALKKIPFNLCSDDFHFDSEIMIQLIMTNQRIVELPISTHYGDERCYVNVIPYGLNILKTLGEYLLTKSRIKVYEKYDL